MSSPLPRLRLAAAAFAVTGLLVGCTGSPGASPSSARPSSAASSAPSALGCSDLADEGELDAALGGVAAAVDPVATLVGAGADVVSATAVPAAGGLQCAWRGTPDGGFTPVLTAQLLPDPDSRWTAMLFGDGPATEMRTYGAHTVIASSGDPGFGATARIGGLWVLLERTFDPQESAADPDDDHDLDAAFTAIFDAASSGGRLGSPAQSPSPASPSPSPSASASDSGPLAGCESLLSTADLGAAVGAPVAYVDQSIPADRLGIEDAARQSAGDLDCFANGALRTVRIRVGHSRAADAVQLKAGVSAPDGVDLVPARLSGLRRSDWALEQQCSGSACSVAASVRGDLIAVDFADDPLAVAAAVIAARH